MRDIAEYNDESKFPLADDIVSVKMNDDHSLHLTILHSDDQLHYHATVDCPPDTKMHAFILTLTGPMIPGRYKIFLEDEPDIPADKRTGFEGF